MKRSKAEKQAILTNLINSLDQLNELLETDNDFHDHFTNEVFKHNTFNKSLDEMMLDFSLMKKNL